MPMREHTVIQGVSMPLGKYLRKTLAALPAGVLSRALRQKDIRRGGVRLGEKDIVRSGDVLSIYIAEEYFTPVLPVMYRDERMLILEKPQGLPSVGEQSMESLAQQLYPDAQACHRLDAMTGGLMLFSLTPKVHERFLEAFRRREIQKTYRCIVKGIPIPEQRLLHAYLRKDAQASRVYITDHEVPDSLSISTRYRTLQTMGDRSELSVDLLTGRTHQIRAHLAHIGHPILGDDRYGDRQFNKAHGVRRQMLWACELVIEGRRFESIPPWEEA